jgi:hypothetical protein
MITHDDNGYARVKRWRERNRALVNLRQRLYRTKKMGLGKPESREHVLEETDESLRARRSTIEELRKLVEKESEKPVEANVVPLVYRDDYGRVIGERQWKTLDEHKRRAKERGYVIDDYSQ